MRGYTRLPSVFPASHDPSRPRNRSGGSHRPQVPKIQTSGNSRISGDLRKIRGDSNVSIKEQNKNFSDHSFFRASQHTSWPPRRILYHNFASPANGTTSREHHKLEIGAELPEISGKSKCHHNSCRTARIIFKVSKMESLEIFRSLWLGDFFLNSFWASR